MYEFSIDDFVAREEIRPYSFQNEENHLYTENYEKSARVLTETARVLENKLNFLLVTSDSGFEKILLLSDTQYEQSYCSCPLDFLSDITGVLVAPEKEIKKIADSVYGMIFSNSQGERIKMKLQIEKRKNTTKKAIVELQKIVAEINNSITEKDVQAVNSDPFDAKMSGTPIHKAFWQIRGGLLALREYDDDAFDINFSDIIRLNFERAVLMLEQVVEKYNKIASEKDEELQKFLNSCEKFWSEKQ
jgi:hypothetical protein